MTVHARTRDLSWRSLPVTPRRSTPWHLSLAGLPLSVTLAWTIPSWDRRLFDLDRAADSDAYCDEVKGTLAQAGVALTELSNHLQGQLVAVHPAYDEAFDGFAPEAVRGNREARQAWAVDQLIKAALALLRSLGPDGTCDVLRRTGLALYLPVATTAAWARRDSIRHVGRALVADPECVRCIRR